MDATTRWETEAIRSGATRRPGPPKPSRKRVADHGPGNWVTLKEAERETGVSVSRIRRWVKRSGLPSYLKSDGDVALRMVDLDVVRARAEELGEPESPPASESPHRRVSPQVAPAAQAASPSPIGAAPDGAMLVPIDAWNKMLNQLGNLHEAGQQLADARERAAKAETEVTFLKERLADLRDARDEAMGEVAMPEARPSGWRARRRARKAGS